VFLAAALLAEHAVTPNEKFHCEGELAFYNTSVRCKSQNKIVAHGDLTLAEIIQKSCNVGIIKASQRLRKDRLFAYMNGLGFGQKTGILPQGGWETGGYFPELKNWVLSTGFYMPIGQGFSVTPIQLIRAGASLANGGRLLRPFIIRRLSTDGGLTWDEGRTESKPNPFPPEVNGEILAMMRRVVTMGTGRLADVPGMSVAGKTEPDRNRARRVITEKYVASFMGFFPADRPRYAALILYDEAGNHESGGSIAAPAFAETVKSILPLIQDHTITVPPLTRGPLHAPKVDPSVLHDFSGMSAREALALVSTHYRIPVQIEGSGYVYRQTPAPGLPIGKVEKIVLFLGDPD
jgi:cell division protein FtsI (penicillin-binding protein 3)